MADTTISALTQGIPAGGSILPYSTGASTLGVQLSAIFQNADTYVAIGSAISAQYKLDVYHDNFNAIRAVGSSSNSVGIYVENRYPGARAYGLISAGGPPGVGPSKLGNFTIYDNTAQLPRFNIDATGNVGIGVNDPLSKLHVNGIVTATGLYAPGCVVQVVQTVKSDVFSTTSQSYVDVTGMSASITPKSASSKIMLMIHIGNTGIDTPNTNLFKILRNDSSLPVGSQASGSMFNVYLQNRGTIPVSFCYVDTPPAGTTYPITYKLQMRNDSGGTSTINMHNTNNTYTTISTFTLQEIAG